MEDKSFIVVRNKGCIDFGFKEWSICQNFQTSMMSILLFVGFVKKNPWRIKKKNAQ